MSENACMYSFQSWNPFVASINSKPVIIAWKNRKTSTIKFSISTASDGFNICQIQNISDLSWMFLLRLTLKTALGGPVHTHIVNQWNQCQHRVSKG